jgi:uncharacterized protein YciI
VKYFALFYDVVDNYLELRVPHREFHLKLAKEALERGEIVMAGALGDPPEAGLLIFRGVDMSIAENFARNDPYVKAGVVTSWRVKPWNVVIGGAQ